MRNTSAKLGRWLAACTVGMGMGAGVATGTAMAVADDAIVPDPSSPPTNSSPAPVAKTKLNLDTQSLQLGMKETLAKARQAQNTQFGTIIKEGVKSTATTAAYTTISNIQKAKHDAALAAIQNTR